MNDKDTADGRLLYKWDIQRMFENIILLHAHTVGFILLFYYCQIVCNLQQKFKGYI